MAFDRLCIRLAECPALSPSYGMMAAAIYEICRKVFTDIDMPDIA